MASGNKKGNEAFLNNHSDVISGAYLCCGFFSFAANGAFSLRYMQSESLLQIKVFTTKNLTSMETWAVGNVATSAIGNKTWTLGLAAAKATSLILLQAGLTGIIVDYEPTTNFTQAHAQAFGDFLGALSAAVSPLSVGIDIAGWGILSSTFWPNYINRGLSRFTSMSSTYYASNITANQLFVQSALSRLPAGSYAAGIGSVVTTPTCLGGNYLWTNLTFPPFVDFLITQGVNFIDIWRCDLDTGYDTTTSDITAPFFLNALSGFLNRSSNTPSISVSMTSSPTMISTPPSNSPSSSPTLSGIDTSSLSASTSLIVSVSGTASPGSSLTQTPSVSPSPSPTQSGTATSSISLILSVSGTASPGSSLSPTPSVSPSSSGSPSLTPNPSQISTMSVTATISPSPPSTLSTSATTVPVLTPTPTTDVVGGGSGSGIAADGVGVGTVWKLEYYIAIAAGIGFMIALCVVWRIRTATGRRAAKIRLTGSNGSNGGELATKVVSNPLAAVRVNTTTNNNNPSKSGAEKVLPQGWQRITEDGDVWFEHDDGTLQWNFPIHSPLLPPGWESVKEDGLTWYEHSDGRLQWERPIY